MLFNSGDHMRLPVNVHAHQDRTISIDDSTIIVRSITLRSIGNATRILSACDNSQAVLSAVEISSVFAKRAV